MLVGRPYLNAVYSGADNLSTQAYIKPYFSENEAISIDFLGEIC